MIKDRLEEYRKKKRSLRKAENRLLEKLDKFTNPGPISRYGGAPGGQPYNDLLPSQISEIESLHEEVDGIAVFCDIEYKPLKMLADRLKSDLEQGVIVRYYLDGWTWDEVSIDIYGDKGNPHVKYCRNVRDRAIAHLEELHDVK